MAYSQNLCGPAIPNTMGPKNDYTDTHTYIYIFFIIWELIPNCTGHLLHMAFWQEFFCVIRTPMEVLCVNATITHSNCLGMNFPITHTHLLHQKDQESRIDPRPRCFSKVCPPCGRKQYKHHQYLYHDTAPICIAILLQKY